MTNVSRSWAGQRVRAALSGGFALALLAAAACGTQPVARLGSPAPDFKLQDVDGESISLADLKGKPVLINFWATWCQPCREEMPAMQELYDQYRDRGLVILAIDMEEDSRQVRRWVDQGGYSFTFLLDSEGEQVKRYNVTAAPTSYFVGPDGVIRDLKLGALSRAEMQTKVEKLVSGT